MHQWMQHLSKMKYWKFLKHSQCIKRRKVFFSCITLSAFKQAFKGSSSFNLLLITSQLLPYKQTLKIVLLCVWVKLCTFKVYRAWCIFRILSKISEKRFPSHKCFLETFIKFPKVASFQTICGSLLRNIFLFFSKIDTVVNCNYGISEAATGGVL